MIEEINPLWILGIVSDVRGSNRNYIFGLYLYFFSSVLHLSCPLTSRLCRVL